MAALRNPDLLKPHPQLGPDGGLIPSLTGEEYRGLRDSIRANGMMQPIVVDHPSMVILDGHHRWLAAKEIGMEQVPVMVQETGTEESNLALGISLNRDRRHMTGEHKRALAAALLTANPAQSDRSVAAAVGVSHTFVGDIRDDMEQGGQLVPGTSSVGRDGKERKRPKATGSRKDRRASARKPKKSMAEEVADAQGRMRQEQEAEAQRIAEARARRAAQKQEPPKADGPVDTAPVSIDTEASSEDAASSPRASSVEGSVVLFVRTLAVPCFEDVDGMTDADADRVALLRAWCGDVLESYRKHRRQTS